MRYRTKARTYERKFMRFLMKHNHFQTVNGAINIFLGCDRDEIYFTTSQGGDLSIKRSNLRKAIYYILDKRTTIRKELERFSNFSSALLGMLFKIFDMVSHVKKLKNGLLRLTLNGVRFFFGGLCRAKGDMELLASHKGTHVILSWFNLREQPSGKWLEHLVRLGLKAIIDSGAYSFYSKNLHTPPVDEWAEFINKYKGHPNIIGFFNLDRIGDPTTTKLNHIKLMGLTGINVLPVWQYNDTIEALEELVEQGHELIGIGGTVPLSKAAKYDELRTIFDKVFSRCPQGNFHWLGGANFLMLEYPFYSADATSWIRARRYGKRDIYTGFGTTIQAPEEMTIMDIMKQKIEFLVSLEDEEKQLSLFWG